MNPEFVGNNDSDLNRCFYRTSVVLNGMQDLTRLLFRMLILLVISFISIFLYLSFLGIKNNVAFAYNWVLDQGNKAIIIKRLLRRFTDQFQMHIIG
jgi:hypothetical protein